MKVLIYGAYGYTGQLIVHEALHKQLKPVIAGRNAEKTKEMARQYKLDHLVFDIQNQEELVRLFRPFDVIVNVAGPYKYTAKLVVEACIEAQKHYLDITGEWEVFEWIKSQDSKAKDAGIMLLPGTGFDVVPSDCLAAFAKSQFPEGTELHMGFKAIGNMSRGTALTMVEGLGEKGVIRRNHTLVPTDNAKYIKHKDIKGKKYSFANIPWGDVSTAHFSTGIPNITLYMSASPKAIRMMRFSSAFSFIMKKKWVKKKLENYVRKNIKGPSENSRKKGKSYLWAEISTGDRSLECRLTTPEGYQLTALTTVLALQKMKNGKITPGYQTPSSAFGMDFIMEIDGVERKVV